MWMCIGLCLNKLFSVIDCIQDHKLERDDANLPNNKGLASYFIST